ncbi:hypothetical protein GGR54DRAFT_643330 [Hypoxylon sp. NC1633]|nr:hypothetical protein GGR54DRAFT_643330 [Hypoxylon sp. NC1633]
MSTIEIIPAELKQAILGELPYDDLISMIHASPICRDAFFGNERLTCKSVLINEVGPTILPMAATLFHAKEAVPNFNRESADSYTRDVISFCRDHLRGRIYGGTVSLDEFNIKMMIKVTKMHQIILDTAEWTEYESFKHTHALANWEDVYPAKPPYGLNNTERHRLIRSLYIYELASTLLSSRQFRRDGTENTNAWNCFWSLFAPWEVAGIMVIESSIKRSVYRQIQATDTIDPYCPATCLQEALDSLWNENEDNCNVLTSFTGPTLVILQAGLKEYHKLLYVADVTESYMECNKQLCVNPNFSEMRRCLFETADYSIWYPSGRQNMAEALQAIEKFTIDESGPRDLWLWTQLWCSIDTNPQFNGHKHLWRIVISMDSRGNPDTEVYCFMNKDTLQSRLKHYPSMRAMIEEAGRIAEAEAED